MTKRQRSPTVTSDPAKMVQLNYGGRRMLTRSASDLFILERTARRLFKISQELDLALEVEITEFKNQRMEVDPDLWPTVSPQVKEMWIEVLPTTEKESLRCESPGSDDENPSSVNSESSDTEEISLDWNPPQHQQTGDPKPKAETPTESGRNKIILNVHAFQSHYRITVRPTDRLGTILDKVRQLESMDATAVYRMIFDGIRLSTSKLVGDYALVNESIIDIQPVQTGGKPVIYLISSRPVQASVHLKLAPEWSFSALYPIGTTQKHAYGGQEMSWDVHVRPDGTLKHGGSGCEVSYLYWEAKSNPSSHNPPSPPCSQPGSPHSEESKPFKNFDPSRPYLVPSNSVLLDIGGIPGYLDKCLTALELHTEARTSFITYWLPSLLEYPHIALRFLPQASYEQAAPLNVTPQPSRVTRIFMLWRGVKAGDVEGGGWYEASERAIQMQVEQWKEIVGIFPEAHDIDGLRVLEWGGMNVTN